MISPSYANHKVTAGIGRILHTILIRQIVKVIPVGFRHPFQDSPYSG